MVANRLIYLVDDTADYRFLIQQIFSRFVSRVEVRFFASGDDLYQSVQKEDKRPNLILMDLYMPPGMSGLDTLRLIKQHPTWKYTPVIIMSSSASNEDVTQCLEAGANSFLNKTVDINQMKELMTSVSNYWLNLNQLPFMDKGNS